MVMPAPAITRPTPTPVMDTGRPFTHGTRTAIGIANSSGERPATLDGARHGLPGTVSDITKGNRVPAAGQSTG